MLTGGGAPSFFLAFRCGIKTVKAALCAAFAGCAVQNGRNGNGLTSAAGNADDVSRPILSAHPSKPTKSAPASWLVSRGIGNRPTPIPKR